MLNSDHGITEVLSLPSLHRFHSCGWNRMVRYVAAFRMHAESVAVVIVVTCILCKILYFTALIATSSIIQTRLLDTFIVVLVQFLVRFSDSQIVNSSHVPGVHDKRLAEFLVVRGSQHRRKSHWAANYVSGSDSSRNGKVDWYLVFIGIWHFCWKYDADTCSNKENSNFHEVWPCILSSSSYHCCWTPRHGRRRLGIDTQSPNPLLNMLNFGMGNQWTLQTIMLRLIYFGHLLTSLLNASFIFEQCCHAASR